MYTDDYHDNYFSPENQEELYEMIAPFILFNKGQNAWKRIAKVHPGSGVEPKGCCKASHTAIPEAGSRFLPDNQTQTSKINLITGSVIALKILCNQVQRALPVKPPL